MRKEHKKANHAGDDRSEERSEATHVEPHRVRLPGFISDGDIGLGDVIKRATSVVGIRPCGGCDRRAQALNRWLVFTGRRGR